MSEENVELGHKVFDALNRAGIEGMLPFFDPAIEWHTDRSVPEPGVYKGADDVARYLQNLFDLLGGEIRVETDRVVSIAEDRIFGQVAAYTTTRGSTREIPLIAWCFIGTARNGKITEIHSYLDREEALEAAGLSE